jgi:predicted outer membrane protein
MNPALHTLSAAFAILLDGSAVFVYGQTGTAGLVSFSDEVVESEVSEAEAERETDEILTYFLRSGPAKCSMAKLAQERGDCEALRDLGFSMMQTEREASKKIQMIAAKRHLYAPYKPSAEWSADLNKLPQQKCPEFDKQFTAGAITKLEDDVRILRRASECQDRWVRLVASDQLPIVESELAQLKMIRDKAAARQ